MKARSLSRSYCVHVLKRNFVFTGGEIVKEFLLSTGYLPGAHDPDCPVCGQIARLQPAWTRGLRKAVLVGPVVADGHAHD